MVWIKKRKKRHEDYDYDDDSDDDDSIHDIENNDATKNERVDSSKIVERGHIHVLKYLKEELHHHWGLQKYCVPAIQHGKIEILKWLKSISCLEEVDIFNKSMNFCEHAVRSGRVGVLEWLNNEGFELKPDEDEDDIPTSLLIDAFKSTEMSQYLLDKGYYSIDSQEFRMAWKKSLEMYRSLYNFGFVFKAVSWFAWCDSSDIDYSFEVIKFLRSKAIPWGKYVLADIVKYGTLEMIRYAREDGCAWSCSCGDEYLNLLERKDYSSEIFKYLVDNGCPFTFDQPSLDQSTRIMSRVLTRIGHRRDLLEFFVGRSSSFDNSLLKRMIENSNYCNFNYKPSFEGMLYILENGNDIQMFNSIEEVFEICKSMYFIKYFHSKFGLPWTVDNTGKTLLLSKLACYNGIDDVKWAYDNGCRGGDVVSYVKKEWDRYGIRRRQHWTDNYDFFEEKGILEIDIQVVGDDHVENSNLPFLKFLVDRGYGFASEMDKLKITESIYKECCTYNSSSGREILALFQQIGIRQF